MNKRYITTLLLSISTSSCCLFGFGDSCQAHHGYTLPKRLTFNEDTEATEDNVHPVAVVYSQNYNKIYVISDGNKYGLHSVGSTNKFGSIWSSNSEGLLIQSYISGDSDYQLISPRAAVYDDRHDILYVCDQLDEGPKLVSYIIHKDQSIHFLQALDIGDSSQDPKCSGMSRDIFKDTIFISNYSLSEEDESISPIVYTVNPLSNYPEVSVSGIYRSLGITLTNDDKFGATAIAIDGLHEAAYSSLYNNSTRHPIIYKFKYKHDIGDITLLDNAVIIDVKGLYNNVIKSLSYNPLNNSLIALTANKTKYYDSRDPEESICNLYVIRFDSADTAHANKIRSWGSDADKFNCVNYSLISNSPNGYAIVYPKTRTEKIYFNKINTMI